MDLNAAIETHRKWLNREEGGKQLELKFSDLRYSDMSHNDLTGSNMHGCDLTGSNMRGCDLTGCDLSGCDMSYNDLRDSVLIGCDLRNCILSGAVGVPTQWQWVSDNLTKTDNGYICYKTFYEFYTPNKGWKIAEGETITENVNFDKCNLCACGINVGTLEYVLKSTKKADVWECLIPFEALAGVCVPYNTDGRFRCEMVKLLKKHTREELLKK